MLLTSSLRQQLANYQLYEFTYWTTVSSRFSNRNRQGPLQNDHLYFKKNVNVSSSEITYTTYFKTRSHQGRLYYTSANYNDCPHQRSVYYKSALSL